MKRLVIFSLSIFSVLALLVESCQDVADVTVTYKKGTPVYGNLEVIRQVPLKGSVRSISDPGKIFVAEDYLLIGEEGEGIHIVDNTNQSNPVNVAFLNIPGNKEYFFHDNILYAESYYDMLKIDLSDPQNPVLLSRIEEAIGSELKNDEGETLLKFDFETVTEQLDKNDDIYDKLYSGESYILYDYAENLIPTSAVPASFAGNSSNKIGSVNRIAHHQGFVYVVSRSNLLVFDDTDGFEQMENANVFGRDLETVYPMGDYLFLGSRSEVLIVDVQDPYSPRQVSSFWHVTSCDPVYPTENDVAYVTLRTGDISSCPGDENALVVLDIEDIDSPHSIQEIRMESPYGLTRSGKKLFVGEGQNGFKIFDASDPRNLVLEEWVKDIPAYDVLYHPTKSDLLLVTGPDGISQYKAHAGEELQLISQVVFP